MFRNAIWPPNLVERTLDQSVTHCWNRGHAGVSQGQAEVKFFRNALWPPNLAERTPDQSVMHRWVKDHAGVSWGQPKDNCLEMRKAIKGSQCYKALCSCRCSSLYSYTPRTLRACCSQSKFRILKIRESSARALFLYNCTPNISRSPDASMSVA